MQELLEHLVNEWSSPSDCWNPSKVIDKVESMIEKEKEQIIDAYYGKINGVFGYREEGQEYYNQTYNQQEDKTFKQKSKWTTQKQHIDAIKSQVTTTGVWIPKTN